MIHATVLSSRVFVYSVLNYAINGTQLSDVSDVSAVTVVHRAL